MTARQPPALLGRIARYVAIVFLIIIIALAANRLGAWLIDWVQFELSDMHKNYMYSAILLSMLFYALLLAIPFVPGVEIGFGLIIMFGTPLVLPVYIATVIGINLSFVLGRVIPATRLQAALRVLYMDKAAALVATIDPLPHKQKIQILAQAAPKRFVPFLLRHRYLAIAAAFNIPGNAIIGGGGGIGLLAGLSRMFPWQYFALTVALGVAPGPLFFLIFGPSVFG